VDQIATFFDMGGYGLFVWPCFVLSALMLLALYLLSRLRLKEVERELAVVEGRRVSRRGQDKPASAGEGLS